MSMDAKTKALWQSRLYQNHWTISNDWEKSSPNSAFLNEPFWSQLDAMVLSREEWTPTSLVLKCWTNNQQLEDTYDVIQRLTSLTALKIRESKCVERMWTSLPPFWSNLRYLSLNLMNSAELDGFQQCLDGGGMTKLEMLLLDLTAQPHVIDLNLESLTQLTTLSVNLLAPSPSKRVALGIMPDLQVLTMRGHTPQQPWFGILPHLTRLEALTYIDKYDLQGNISSYLPVTSHLTTLVLRFHPATRPNKALYQHLPNLPGLKVADMSFNAKDSDDWLDWLSESSLTHLPDAFWNCDNLPVMTRMTGLQRLDIKQCPLSQRIYDVLGQMTQVVHLSVYYQFQDYHLLTGMTRLEILDDFSFNAKKMAETKLHLPALTELEMNLNDLDNPTSFQQLSDFLQRHTNLLQLKLHIFDMPESYIPLWSLLNTLPLLTSLHGYMTYGGAEEKNTVFLPPNLKLLDWDTNLVISHTHLALEELVIPDSEDDSHVLDDGSDPLFMTTQNRKRNKRLIDLLVADVDFQSWVSIGNP